MLELLIGLVVGCVVGILFGRRNQKKVEAALVKVKEEYEKLQVKYLNK